METTNNKSLDNSLNGTQGKDSENIGINPSFDLEKFNPESLAKEVEKLEKQSIESTNHDEILNKLLNEIEPVDFLELVFPIVKDLRKKLESLDPKSEDYKATKDKIDEYKVNTKHYLIISIEQILSKAKANKWSLAKNNDFVYIYNGCYWSEIDEKELQKFLGEASEKLSVSKFNARFFTFRESLLKQFHSTAYLPAPEHDVNKVFINLINGTFEIDGEKQFLRPFNENDFITYQLPFEYNPQAEAPKFQKYLDEVLPDIERQNLLAEYIGSIFIKNGSNRVKTEKALFLYGSGANGKSVFYEIINALLGIQNVSNYTLQNLTDDKGYQRAKIGAKLVNYCSDISTKMEAGMYKQLVSGEPVEARLPYGQPFELRQYAKLIFNSNDLPKDVEQTNAFFRRFLIIPFDVTIPEEQQDRNLHTKIIENELAGVFNWVLNGLNRLLNQKRFSHCKASDEALNQYKLESDSVQQFILESNYIASEHYTLLKDLYPEYRNFCYEDGMNPVKKSNFIKRLEALKFVKDRVTGNQVAIFIQKK